jgi:hypothetical protein
VSLAFSRSDTPLPFRFPHPHAALGTRTSTFAAPCLPTWPLEQERTGRHQQLARAHTLRRCRIASHPVKEGTATFLSVSKFRRLAPTKYKCERHITPFPKRRSPSARDVRTVSEIPACAGSRGMKGTASCSCPHRWDATPEDDLRRLLSRHVCAKTGDERGHFHSKRCRHRCC